MSQEDPLEEEMATHSSILAWGIPWTEAPGGLLSMGLQSQTLLRNAHPCWYFSMLPFHPASIQLPGHLLLSVSLSLSHTHTHMQCWHMLAYRVLDALLAQQETSRPKKKKAFPAN